MIEGEADCLVQQSPGSCPRGGGNWGRRLLGRVAATERLGSMVRLALHVPGWRGARAGQFALLQPEPSRCFLARAFSVCDEAGETVSFLIAPVGEGTRELSSLSVGAGVWVLGPLGNGFDVDGLVRSLDRTVVVAGGVGLAPFPLLLAQMAVRCRDLYPHPAGAGPGTATAAGPEVLVLLGFRDLEQARGAEVMRQAAKRAEGAGLRLTLEIATEDGSHGNAGRVTDLLEDHLRSGDRLAVCGPELMASAVWQVCSRIPRVQVWFNLEGNMACGVGSCHGCVVKMADGSYARVCHEGPVFSGSEVFGG